MQARTGEWDNAWAQKFTNRPWDDPLSSEGHRQATRLAEQLQSHLVSDFVMKFQSYIMTIPFIIILFRLFYHNN